jgi:hypothetical protein
MQALANSSYQVIVNMAPSFRTLTSYSLAAVAGLLIAPSQQQGSEALQNILQNTHKSNLYTYPTDFTRGIVPKQIHSHNDYWRDVPFYTGLSYGAISTEADVWLINGTLYVSLLHPIDRGGADGSDGWNSMEWMLYHSAMTNAT